MNLFIANIAQCVTVPAGAGGVKRGRAMRDLGVITDAGLLCRNGRIAWVGPMSRWTEELPGDFPRMDARGKVVLPGFVDSHTHMMFAGDRAHEFALRAEGATYQQIAEQGGGILSTIAHVRAASRKDLKKRTARWLGEMMRYGTTTVEIKSGYGLETASELKMMEAITELREEEVVGVVPTFMGAHAVPPEFRGDPAGYVRLVTEEMIPLVGKRRLAAFCDVFCERGYFDPADARRILEAGRAHGMRPKVHADEITPLGGAQLAAELGAVSADHLEHVTDDGIAALRDAGTVATVLPGVSFFLNHGYAPARRLIDGGATLAIASDFNPGSCMSFSMPLMMTIACTQMRMTPEEAITAATLHGAAALGLASDLGSIEPGKRADLVVADVPDYRHLAYHFGFNHAAAVIKGGTILEQ
ncbi:MAG: imidazolonepropionase [Bacteroidota bacterium]